MMYWGILPVNVNLMANYEATTILITVHLHILNRHMQSSKNGVEYFAPFNSLFLFLVNIISDKCTRQHDVGDKESCKFNLKENSRKLILGKSYSIGLQYLRIVYCTFVFLFGFR